MLSFSWSGPFTWPGAALTAALCEEVCPADIPLRVLYKKGQCLLVKELLGYETGSPDSRSLPLEDAREKQVTLETKPM
jgi:L-lactate utilization protein LutB